MTRFLKFNFIIFISFGFILSLLVVGCQRDRLSSPKDYTITCYAATYGKGIYKSDNGGTSWYPFDMDQKAIHAYYKRLYKSPHDKDVLYVTTTGAGLFTLNLQTEVLEGVNRFQNENVSSISMRRPLSNQQSPLEILVGIKGGGVFKTVDSHGPWQPLNDGLTYHDVNIILSHGKAVFTGTVKDLFMWEESSGRWISSSKGIKNKNVISIGAGAQEKVMYAGSGSYGEEKGFFEDIPCLYKSTDNGRTWTASDKGIPDGTLIYVISVNPHRSESIYLGTSDGVYRSTDGGQNWVKMEDGLPKNLKIFDIKIARMTDGKDVVYAAGSRGVFMTIDDEETFWVNKSYGLEPTAITSIILFPN